MLSNLLGYVDMCGLERNHYYGLILEMFIYYVELCWIVWFREEPFVGALYWRCTDFDLVTSYWFRRGDWWWIWDFSEILSLGSERDLRWMLELEVETSIKLCCLLHSHIMYFRDRCTSSEEGTNDESGTLV